MAKMEWVDADAGVTLLRRAIGQSGFGGADSMPVFYQAAGLSGVRLSQMLDGPAHLTLAVNIRATTRSLYEVERRTLMAALKNGPGTLRHTDTAGLVWELPAVYMSGLGASDTEVDSQLAQLEFQSDGEPYWQSTVVNTTVWATPVITELWLPQSLFPVVTPSEVFDTATVTNSGDVHAWPTWVIDGPGENPFITNDTTGLTLTFVGLTLLVGEVLTVNTNPGVVTADVDGATVWSSLTDASTFWPLAPGASVVRLGMGGAGGTSSFTLTYSDRQHGE